jgi:hypothetical protein
MIDLIFILKKKEEKTDQIINFIILISMDSDEEDSEKHKEQRNTISVIEGYIFDVINVFSTFWLRCDIFNDNEHYRVFYNYRHYFLPYFGTLLYFIYFITKIIK